MVGVYGGFDGIVACGLRKAKSVKITCDISHIDGAKRWEIMASPNRGFFCGNGLDNKEKKNGLGSPTSRLMLCR